ncbi:Hypothetical predicted protein [Cloeon dipterum]|uniref:Uncharacterized protein n=1 Tax=Cloeon dipterum TaxID=197152 RepID=A0A8S1DHV8_9INSE|nr:Hypothetical predicted protein [Cloeon dipterum]
MTSSQPIEVKIYEASEEEDDPVVRVLSSSYTGPGSSGHGAPQHLFTPVTMSEVGREGRQWLTTRSVKRIDCRSMESLRQQSSTTTSSAHLSQASSCSLRSMESLRSSSTESTQHHQPDSACLLTANRYAACTYKSTSERDMRQVASCQEASSSAFDRTVFKRRAVSGEEIVRQNSTGGHSTGGGRSSTFLSATGLCEVAGGERKLFVPQHLSLPGSDSARRLTILSPHSPQPEAFQITSTMCTIKTRQRRAIVLPKLVLPRSESDVFSV